MAKLACEELAHYLEGHYRADVNLIGGKSYTEQAKRLRSEGRELKRLRKEKLAQPSRDVLHDVVPIEFYSKHADDSKDRELKRLRTLICLADHIIYTGGKDRGAIKREAARIQKARKK